MAFKIQMNSIKILLSKYLCNLLFIFGTHEINADEFFYEYNFNIFDSTFF